MLIIPVVMLLLLVGVQFALWSHAAQVVQLAATEGDRAARVYGGSALQGQERAQAVLDDPGSDVVASSVDVVMAPGGIARVSVTGHAVSILPGLALPVSATDVGAVQEFRSSE